MKDKKISEIVDSVDKKFKEIERRKKLVEKMRETSKKPPPPEGPDGRLQRLKEQQELQKFRIKEKLFHTAIVFVIGHLILTPLYMKYPEYALNMFLFSSISLGVICIAVIDYT